MTTNILDAQHLLSSSSDFRETLNNKSIAISTLSLIIAGIILAAASFIGDKSSTLYLVAVSLPFVLLLVSLLRLMYQRKQLVYAPTSSRIISGHLYFDKSQMAVVKSMLQADTPENIEWTGFKKHGNARLDYMVSLDGHFAAIQLHEYVPYNYEPASQIFSYADNQVHPMAQLLLQYHSRGK